MEQLAVQTGTDLFTQIYVYSKTCLLKKIENRETNGCRKIRLLKHMFTQKYVYSKKSSELYTVYTTVIDYES